MKIALFIGSLCRGGAERVIVTLAENFIKKGHEVTIVTVTRFENEYPISPSIKRIVAELLPEEMGSGRISNLKRRLDKLKNIWKQENPDVILSFIGKNNFYALMTARKLKIPIAVSVRANPDMEYPDRVSKMLMKWLYPKADKVILQTRDSFDFFPESVQSKSQVLKNPINPNFYDRQWIDIADRENKIVAVGRVDDNKNHEMIIRAFAKISCKYPDYKLYIYGDGDLRGQLIKLVEELGLSNQIFLPGISSDVPADIEKAKLFILSSDTEGMPNTLLEAMALGVPVISTDCPCGGPKEIIRNGENGYLVPVRDTDALSHRIDEMLIDESYLETMAKNAQAVSEGYREENVAIEWLNMLQNL